MALVKKGSTFFNEMVPLPGEPSILGRADELIYGENNVPKEVLDFEGLSKPGLGAHGAAVRFPEQSEADIQNQLKVYVNARAL